MKEKFEQIKIIIIKILQINGLYVRKCFQLNLSIIIRICGSLVYYDSIKKKCINHRT
jgi:hypothetical protein